MTRLRLFYIVLVGSLFYYFLPGWIFTALSYFSWICWIAPSTSLQPRRRSLWLPCQRADPALSAPNLQTTLSSTNYSDQHLASAWAC